MKNEITVVAIIILAIATIAITVYRYLKDTKSNEIAPEVIEELLIDIGANKHYDVIFMKINTYEDIAKQLRYTMTSKEENKMYGYGTLNGMSIMIYDEANELKQLNDYAQGFIEMNEREPSILKVK